MMVTSAATISYKITKQIHTSQVYLEINPKKTKYTFHTCYQKKKRTESYHKHK